MSMFEQLKVGIHRRAEFTDSPAGISARDDARLPKLVVFDLDDTVWTPEMWEMSGGFRHEPPESTRVVDKRGTQLRLHPGAERAIAEIKTARGWQEAGTEVAYASRTDCPEWAKEALRMMRVCGGLTLHDAANYAEIYPVRSKTEQFEKLRRKAGVEYELCAHTFAPRSAPYDEEMLFFDNERRNCDEVGTLGVHCVYTPGGMTERHWTEGLAAYAKHIRAHVEENMYESPANRRERSKGRRTPSWGSLKGAVAVEEPVSSQKAGDRGSERAELSRAVKGT